MLRCIFVGEVRIVFDKYGPQVFVGRFFVANSVKFPVEDGAKELEKE